MVFSLDVAPPLMYQSKEEQQIHMLHHDCYKMTRPYDGPKATTLVIKRGESPAPQQTRRLTQQSITRKANLRTRKNSSSSFVQTRTSQTPSRDTSLIAA